MKRRSPPFPLSSPSLTPSPSPSLPSTITTTYTPISPSSPPRLSPVARFSPSSLSALHQDRERGEGERALGILFSSSSSSSVLASSFYFCFLVSVLLPSFSLLLPFTLLFLSPFSPSSSVFPLTLFYFLSNFFVLFYSPVFASSAISSSGSFTPLCSSSSTASSSCGSASTSSYIRSFSSFHLLWLPYTLLPTTITSSSSSSPPLALLEFLPS